MRPILKSVLILIFISSCAPKIKNFDKYQNSAINESQFLPSKEELKQPLPKVIVFDFDDKNILVAKNANLSNSLAKNVEAIITENKLAEIVDRDLGQKLKDEIALAQINGDLSYQGPAISDFAITGTIFNANFTSNYIDSKSSYNSKTKQYTYTPAKYEYTANVGAIVKIVELPSLNVVKTLEFNESESYSEDVQTNGGLKIAGIEIGTSNSQAKTQDDGLVRNAAYAGIRFIEEDIKNTLAKKGYILEKRKYKKKTIFKINLGSNDGIKHGDKFHVIGRYLEQNPISKESEEESKIIAEGVISDKINENSAWVVIKGDDNIEKIRMGDKVQIFYKKSIYKKNQKTFKTIGKILGLLIDIAEIFAKQDK